MKNKLKVLLSSLILIAFASCGGGGGDDDGGTVSGDVCALKIFQGTLCPVSTDSVVEIIFKDSSGQPMALCSGTIIDSNAVLTAGHCFDVPGIGTADIISGGVTYSAIESRVHPLYNPAASLTPFDSAIIYTAQPFTAAALPIRVSRAPSSGENIRILGYGQDESGLSLFEQDIRGTGPKAADSTIFSSEDGVFVAGNPNQGVCSGDSGGPAIIDISDANPAVAGIAQAGAFVDGCSDSILTRQEIESIRGQPFSDAELEGLLPFSKDGGKTFAVNFYTDVSFPGVTNFITANVPGVELK